MENPLFDIFIEEAEENLEILESRILILEQEPQNQEMINEAFRAIHSLKGGAGLAGFHTVKDFAHKAEDLFESIRSGTLVITPDIGSVLLRILDTLKMMIGNLKGGIEADKGVETDELLKTMAAANGNAAPEPARGTGIAASETLKRRIYYLHLEYYPELFKSGIDPLMFIQDLQRTGEILELELDPHNLPDKKTFDPELFYLNWKLFYASEFDMKELSDIFCFVIDESNIQIKNIEEIRAAGENLQEYKVNSISAEEILHSREEANEKETLQKQLLKRGYKRTSDLNIGSYIRVPTAKLENIFNTVSELIISQARISMLSEEYEDILPDNFMAVTDMLKNITQLMQEQVTSLRMISLGGTFDRFKRVVHDIAADLGKKVNLSISGQETELDKNMIEKLNDPLKHIVRNSIDHGIESTEERVAAGKPAEGELQLKAYIENGNVVIEIIDDGQGINREKILEKAISLNLISPQDQLSDGEVFNLIFHPGLSTAERVTDLSGRGVGMDVVKNAISDLNGSIDVSSTPGEGTSFRINLPLTLAILDGMLVSIGKEKYIIPTLSILEIFRPEPGQLKTISSKGEVVFFRGDYIPLIRLHAILNVQNAEADPLTAELIVINNNGLKVALLVDNVLEQYQIVLKSLQKNFRKVENISSATILGNGDVALILDIPSIVQKKGT